MRTKVGLVILSFLFLFLLSCEERKKDATMVTEVQQKKKEKISVYTNPVLDINFPDPTAIKAIDGYYYVYATNSFVDGKAINIQVRRSKDLVEWEDMGDALPKRPVWGEKDFWAPHVYYDEKLETYFLYYSAESKDAEFGKCMGVATSKNPAGPFVDKGEPMICGDGFENIDPMVLNDPASGKIWLYWGSGFEPIRVQELSDDLLNFKKGSKPKDLIFTAEDEASGNYQRLVEGAWVTKNGDYYYLYFSGDNCCGDQAHYAAMVARSKNATGPFEKLEEDLGEGSSVILEMKGRWIAPGHNSVIKDEAGADWMVYHAIDSLDRSKGRVMLIDKILYKDGWPNINGGHPSNKENHAPIVN